MSIKGRMNRLETAARPQQDDCPLPRLVVYEPGCPAQELDRFRQAFEARQIHVSLLPRDYAEQVVHWPHPDGIDAAVATVLMQDPVLAHLDYLNILSEHAEDTYIPPLVT